MKFDVSSTKLFVQLQAVTRVIASKNSLPILDDVLFELKGNSLQLTASDGETTIQTIVEVENAEGEGKVAFGAKLLLDTLKEFSEQPINFVINDENFGMNLTSSNGTYSYVGANGDEYPVMDSENKNESFTIPTQILLDAIGKTLFCTADDELRPVMNGIFVNLTPENLTMVATNAHRLVRYINSSVTAENPIHFIFPKKPAALIKNVLPKEENVTIWCTTKNIHFEFGQTVVVCRQIEGNYPNYNAVIPQNNQNQAIVDRQTLLNACKRVAVYANTGTSLLKLAFAENTINISAQDIDFSTSAEETIACSYTDAPISIGFKAPSLIEIINVIPSTDLLIKLSDPARAGLIRPAENEENEDLLLLITPMLLSD